MDVGLPMPQGARWYAVVTYLLLDWEYIKEQGFMVLRVRPAPNLFFISVIYAPHGACRASLRLPKEKKYETRVFR